MARTYYIVVDAERLDYESLAECCYSVGDVFVCDCDVKRKLGDESIRQVRIVGVIEFAAKS